MDPLTAFVLGITYTLVVIIPLTRRTQLRK